MTQCSFSNCFEQNFFNQMCEKELWKRISGSNEIKWTIEQLNQNADKIDWKELSGNRNMVWNIDMIAKFIHRIDFTALSEAMFGWRSTIKLEHIEIVRKYADRLEWSLLSSSELPSITGVIDEFADRWDWKELIGNQNAAWTKPLFEKYRNRILLTDIDTFTRSELFNCLMKIEEKILIGKILSE